MNAGVSETFYAFYFDNPVYLVSVQVEWFDNLVKKIDWILENQYK